MANPNSPFGFRLHRNQNGDFPRIRPYTGTSAAIGAGAILKLDTSGTVSVWNGTNTTDRNRLIGMAVTPKAASATDATVYVADSPHEEFVVQLDDKSVTNIGGLVGRFFPGVNMASRNSTLNQSIAAIDASAGTSVNNSTTLAVFQGLKFYGEVGNVATQSYAQIVVRINPINHILGNATVGV